MQALSVAVRLSAAQKLLNKTITYLMANSLTVPDDSPDVAGTIIPTETIRYFLNELTLTQGSLSDIAASIGQVSATSVQSQYEIALTASFNVSFGDWYEAGYFSTPDQGKEPAANTPFSDHFKGFHFSVDNLSATLVFSFTATGNNWDIQLVSASKSAVTLGKIHVPKQSVLDHPSLLSCINKKIDEELRSKIEKTDFITPLASAIKKELSKIPVSVSYLDISYQFNPNTFTYPDGGIGTGVSGEIAYNDESYKDPNTTVLPDTPNASVYPESDLNFYISNFEFDAVAWAFFEKGELQLYVTPNMLPGHNILNTGNELLKTIFPDLYKYAPDSPIDVQIDATQAPYTYNIPTYLLSPDSLAVLKSEVSDAVYTALDKFLYPNGHDHQPAENFYTDEQSFISDIENQGGIDNIPEYDKEAILSTCKTVAMMLKTYLTLGFYVTRSGEKVIAFNVEIEKDDLVGNYQLVTDGDKQKITITFTEINMIIGQIITVPQLDSKGDRQLIQTIWELINPYFNTQLQQMGDDGYLLPKHPQLEYTILDVSVLLNEQDPYGYVQVALKVS